MTLNLVLDLHMLPIQTRYCSICNKLSHAAQDCWYKPANYSPQLLPCKEDIDIKKFSYIF